MWTSLGPDVLTQGCMSRSLQGLAWKASEKSGSAWGDAARQGLWGSMAPMRWWGSSHSWAQPVGVDSSHLPPAPRGPHLLSSLHYRFSLWPPNRSLWLWILWQRQNQYVVKIVASFLPQICQIQILETKHVKFSVSILMLLVNFLATYSCPCYKFFLNVWFFAFKFHI